MFIGEPFVSFILDHAQINPLRITVEEALERLEDVHKRGWVSSMFFKDICGQRSYAICNCCPCCCVGLRIDREVRPLLQYPIRQFVSSGYVAKINEELCTGCQACKKKCPFDAYAFDAEEKKINLIYDNCMGCGACVDLCKAGAISLVLDPKKGVPLDVDVICKK
jgi:NAD-dependent dihydropyrimidine dehydrogenase PreA subunit